MCLKMQQEIQGHRIPLQEAFIQDFTVLWYDERLRGKEGVGLRTVWNKVYSAFMWGAL